jgi:hypothetical protein
MQPDDQVAELLVRWEEARAADRPAPALDQLPAELRPRAREGLRLLRGFARVSHGLATTGPAPPGDAPPAPPDTPRYRFEALLGRGGNAAATIPPARTVPLRGPCQHCTSGCVNRTSPPPATSSHPAGLGVRMTTRVERIHWRRPPCPKT